MDGRKLFVSFKIAERCNLACDYCYFFFNGDSSSDDRPAIVAKSTVRDVGRFLGDGARDLGIKAVVIALHGGEPLMVGKRRFATFVETLMETISPHATLRFGIQTNGVLLDEEWLDLLARYSIRLGISIDGPKHIHDSVRTDHKGGGSYDRVVAALELAQAHRAKRGLEEPGAIAVVHPGSSAREVYNHLVHELGLRRLDFLLPKDNWDNFDARKVQLVGDFYLDLLDCWLEDDDPTINIRTLKVMLAPFLTDLGLDIRTNHLMDLTEAITIRSDGDVSPDDTLPSLGQQFRDTGHNVSRSTLAEFYADPVWDDIRATVHSPPDACAGCEWLRVCGGGEIVTRYSKALGFNNPTIYCQYYKGMFARIRDYISQQIQWAPIGERTARSRDAAFTPKAIDTLAEAKPALSK
jgi:uncharacterized protein